MYVAAATVSRQGFPHVACATLSMRGFPRGVAWFGDLGGRSPGQRAARGQRRTAAAAVGDRGKSWRIHVADATISRRGFPHVACATISIRGFPRGVRTCGVVALVAAPKGEGWRGGMAEAGGGSRGPCSCAAAGGDGRCDDARESERRRTSQPTAYSVCYALRIACDPAPQRRLVAPPRRPTMLPSSTCIFTSFLCTIVCETPCG